MTVLFVWITSPEAVWVNNGHDTVIYMQYRFYTFADVKKAKKQRNLE